MRSSLENNVSAGRACKTGAVIKSSVIDSIAGSTGVHSWSIIPHISKEQPGKHGFNVGPASNTVGQH